MPLPKIIPLLNDIAACRVCAAHLPHYFPLPHSSPRNRFWLSRNPWFAEEALPALRKHVAEVLTR